MIVDNVKRLLTLHSILCARKKSQRQGNIQTVSIFIHFIWLRIIYPKRNDFIKKMYVYAFVGGDMACKMATKLRLSEHSNLIKNYVLHVQFTQSHWPFRVWLAVDLPPQTKKKKRGNLAKWRCNRKEIGIFNVYVSILKVDIMFINVVVVVFKVIWRVYDLFDVENAIIVSISFAVIRQSGQEDAAICWLVFRLSARWKTVLYTGL